MTFTQAKELKAAKIGRRFKDLFADRNRGEEIRTGARIWNNPRWMFDNPVRGSTVLVGVHIGGTPAVVGSAYEGPDANWHCCELQQSPDEPCNEWVCGTWDKEGTTAQEKMLCVFDSLFSPGNGREVLLETPSFDACPIRVNEADQIPPEIWADSKSWFYSVLEHLQPSLIICNRNTEPGGKGKSAWAAILQSRAFGTIVRQPDIRIHGNGFLKHAKFTARSSRVTNVIGLPQLTYWGTDKLWTELRKLGVELSLR